MPLASYRELAIGGKTTFLFYLAIAVAKDRWPAYPLATETENEIETTTIGGRAPPQKNPIEKDSP